MTSSELTLGQRSASYSRSHHLYLAKYTLLATAVPLVCYHHGLSRDELTRLPVSSLTVADEVVTLTTPMGATRPLSDLELVYHQTLEVWYHLRQYEDPQECLFGVILKDGRLSPYPITASYTELMRFVFLVDAGCHASTPERISRTLMRIAGHAEAVEWC